jgi:CDP-diacylglycerol--serine O-phosphatidyltransferase
MVSTIRYPSGKQIDLQTRTRLTSFVLFFCAAAVIVVFKEVAMLVVTLGYIFFGLIRQLRRNARRKAA